MNDTTQYDNYHSEIFNFLKTTTIKFEPLSIIVGESLKNNIDYTIDTTTTNYYYKRLMGEYIPGDELMYVTSIDTGEKILFSKENLKLHPKTAAIYKVPNIEYTLLCKKYTSQIDLIKSIVYPINDINLLKKSPNICYLNGDTSLLQSNEVTSIISGINKFLTIAQDRWWVKEYCFEEGYPIAFYTLLWQLLPLICFTTRMTNIKTSSAHLYHIWEYLVSKGLEDYRDILSLNQSLFFYRNMEYILSHKGTTENLFILADNVLSEFSIALIAKYIYQQQTDRYDECRRTPEIISKQLISYLRSDFADTNTFETIETINGRMYNKGIEVKNDSQYISNLEKTLGECEEDRLPTKLLELRKETVSNSYEALLIEFILDTVVYLISKNKLSYFVEFKDPYLNSSYKISVQDALAMWYYFCFMSFGEEPILLPTFGMTRINYALNKPNKNELPQNIYVEDTKYLITQFVDVDQLLNEITSISETIKSASQMQTIIYNQFSSLVKHIRDVRSSCDLCYTKSMLTVYNKLCDPGKHLINLSLYNDYNSFFNQNELYSQLRNAYKEINNKDYYDSLCSTLFSAIVPITDKKFSKYVGFLDSFNTIFEKMTSLCIQLFSHNVTLLGTDRAKNQYLYLTPIAVHHLKTYGNTEGTLADWFLLNYDGYDRTKIFDTQNNNLLFHQQKDITQTSDVYLPSLKMKIHEYGISVDKSRFSTNIKYTFS